LGKNPSRNAHKLWRERYISADQCRKIISLGYKSGCTTITRETLIYPQIARIDADGKLETSAKICGICGRKKSLLA
jgi:hypothetical protein